MDLDLSEKIVLLTGVGGGIGNAFLEYLKPKAKKVITSSRSKRNEIMERSISEGEHDHYSFDLTEEANIKSLMSKIQEAHGKVDIFINTMGGSLFSSKLEETTRVKFLEVLNLNLISAFLLTREVIKLMKTNGGNIIHMVSSSAKRFPPNKGPYAIAKAALVKMIQYYAMECANYDIRVNGISPTYVFTPRHEREIAEKAKNSSQAKTQIIDHLIVSQLIKKPMKSEDLIPALELLISTKVMTGQVVNCTLGEVLHY